jgi:hypothetical protein
MHIRRLFLEDLRTQLKTLPNYGGVWIQRCVPTRGSFPAITVFSDNETQEFNTIGPVRCQNRYLTVSVIVWIRGSVDDEKIEIDMDNASLDIEQKLRTPTGADDFYMVSTDFQYSEEDGDLSAVTLTYKLEYSTNEFDPVY